MMQQANHINPNDPAVIPTDTKKPNSTKSREPGGICVKNIAKGSICYEKIKVLITGPKYRYEPTRPAKIN